LSSLAQGKKVNIDEIESSAGMGFAFGGLKGLKNFKGWDAADEKLKNVWADRFAMATQNFMNASPDAIDNVVNYGQTDSDLFAQATEMAAKARVEMEPTKKTKYAAMASTLAKMSDIRGTVDAIINDVPGFIDSIEKSELPEDKKQELIQKAKEIANRYSTANSGNKSAGSLTDNNTPESESPITPSAPVEPNTEQGLGAGVPEPPAEAPATPEVKKPTVDTNALDELDNELEGLKQPENSGAKKEPIQPTEPVNEVKPAEKATPIEKQSTPAETPAVSGNSTPTEKPVVAEKATTEKPDVDKFINEPAEPIKPKSASIVSAIKTKEGNTIK